MNVKKHTFYRWHLTKLYFAKVRLSDNNNSFRRIQVTKNKEPRTRNQQHNDDDNDDDNSASNSNPIWGRSVFFRDDALAPRGASTPTLRSWILLSPVRKVAQTNPNYPPCRQDTTSPMSTDWGGTKEQLNTDPNASNDTYFEIQEKRKEDTFFWEKNKMEKNERDEKHESGSRSNGPFPTPHLSTEVQISNVTRDNLHFRKRNFSTIFSIFGVRKWKKKEENEENKKNEKHEKRKFWKGLFFE